MSTKKQIAGYVVMQELGKHEGVYIPLYLSSNEYENTPDDGILHCESADKFTMFATRASARSAINRTHHWQKAFDNQDVETGLCKIVPVYAQIKARLDVLERGQ